MSEYVPTIGLEIHAELKTATKMFCRSKNDADEARPNVNTCPVCLAHPGTLPVVNREAVRSVLRLGVALGSRLATYTEFDRKNYFYPDLPKGYQISQYEYPLVSGGSLNGVPLTRVHLEEDTASSIHNEETGETLVDYNRAGVPLMELVTEPAMHSASEASSFARELKVLLRYLGISNANMEKGEMRVEANVSVARPGERATAYVEIKNLNSFRAMEKAVEHEIARQIELIQSGGAVVKQTLGWDENKGVTFPQRTKEGAADYRYFPDPDIPSMNLGDIPDFARSELAATLPELPWERRQRYMRLGIKVEDAQLYVSDTALGGFVDSVLELLPTAQVSLASNYIANDLVSLNISAARDTQSRDGNRISSSDFCALIELIEAGKLSSRGAKQVLARMHETGETPAVIAEQEKLFQISDVNALSAIVDNVITEQAAAVADFKAGKEASLKFLIGQAMRLSKGAGSPETIRTLLIERIQ
jgi:aspartyl-tRNA(Asn)/glutamyl-tRNA(Gln) amidotransferase subunit B